jgi:hypothetical protein
MTFSLLRAARALLLSVAAIVTFNAAAALPPNYSDLWWNQDEPGWGVNISQQADTLFATFFVYGTGGQAVWYSVTLTYQSTSANGVVTYGGTLYQTSGSPQGTPYDPALLRYRQVGDATIEFGDDAHGLLRYTADGVLVVRSIARQTFATISPEGTYLGATTDVTFNCKTPSRNGIVTADPGPLRITLVDGFATIYAPTCFYEGNYVQQGQVGSLDGRYECTNGAQGAVTVSGLRVEKGGLVGNYTGRDASCEFRGNIGGARTLP